MLLFPFALGTPKFRQKPAGDSGGAIGSSLTWIYKKHYKTNGISYISSCSGSDFQVLLICHWILLYFLHKWNMTNFIKFNHFQAPYFQVLLNFHGFVLHFLHHRKSRSWTEFVCFIHFSLVFKGFLEHSKIKCRRPWERPKRFAERFKNNIIKPM